MASTMQIASAEDKNSVLVNMCFYGLSQIYGTLIITCLIFLFLSVIELIVQMVSKLISLGLH